MFRPLQHSTLWLTVLLPAVCLGQAKAQTPTFTTAFSDNFDSDPVGSAPSGWASVGTTSNAVAATNAISSPNAFGEASPRDGDVIIYKGSPAQTNPFAYSTEVVSTTALSVQAQVICSDPTGTNFYMCNENTVSGVFTFYKCVNSSFSQLAQFSFPITLTNNEHLARRFWEYSGTLYARFWPMGTAEPATSQSIVDSNAPFTSGFSGFRTGTNSGAPSYADDFATGATTPTASSVVTPATSASIHTSFLQWHPSSANAAEMETNASGSWEECVVSGTANVSEQFDVASPVQPGAVIRWSIDNGPYQNATVAANVSLATGLSTASHDVKVWVPFLTQVVDRWGAPASVVRLVSVTTDQSSTVSAPANLPTQGVVVYTDSRGGEGGVADCTLGWPYLVGQGFGMETGVRAFSGMGWQSGPAANNATGDIVPFYTPGNDSQSAWNKFDSTHSLFAGGLYPANLGMIIACYGINDTRTGQSDASVSASVQGFLTSARAATPSASIPLVIVQDFSGDKQTAVQAGFNGYQVAHPDPYAYLVPMSVIPGLDDNGPSALSADGAHPTAQGQAIITAKVAAAIQARLNYAAPKLIRRLN